MKITKVEVFEFICEGKPFFRVIGCRVYTDEGIYGDGEAALSYGVGASAAFGMVKDLAKLVIGMDPMENEVIWHKLYRTTFWGQAGGPVVYAGISALDVALWDIKGKALGVPVCQLLGGRVRDSVPVYFNGWFAPAKTPEDFAETAARCRWYYPPQGLYDVR